MIAVIEVGPTLHIIRWTGRMGLKVVVKTYCNQTINASSGVLQVPDQAEVCAECRLNVR